MSEAVDYVALLTAVPSVLVVGDESFEFSLGLAEAAAARGKSAGRWLCATAYEAAPVDAAAATRAAELGCLGAVVRQGVDATRLEGMHLCEPSIQVDWIPPPAFGAVVFNFPYVVVEGRRPRVDDNRELLVKFFASARRVLRPGGLVVVALARAARAARRRTRRPGAARRDAYQNSWRILDAAARADLVLAAAGPPQFPGNYAPAGYRRRGADRRIADSYVKLSVAHVFRPEGSCMPRHAVEFAHDLSFWLPATAAVDEAFAACPAMAPVDGIDDAFAACAAAAAAAAGVGLLAATRTDAYACPTTGATRGPTARSSRAAGARARNTARPWSRWRSRAARTKASGSCQGPTPTKAAVRTTSSCANSLCVCLSTTTPYELRGEEETTRGVVRGTSANPGRAPRGPPPPRRRASRRLCENQPTKSFLGDDVAALAPSSRKESTSPRKFDFHTGQRHRPRPGWRQFLLIRALPPFRPPSRAACNGRRRRPSTSRGGARAARASRGAL